MSISIYPFTFHDSVCELFFYSFPANLVQQYTSCDVGHGIEMHSVYSSDERHISASKSISFDKNWYFTVVNKRAVPFTGNQYWIKDLLSGKMSKFEFSIEIALVSGMYV